MDSWNLNNYRVLEVPIIVRLDLLGTDCLYYSVLFGLVSYITTPVQIDSLVGKVIPSNCWDELMWMILLVETNSRAVFSDLFHNA